MNSMSKRCNDDCRRERECEREREHEDKKCPTIIKCGCPSSTPINKAREGECFIVASLTLDTSCLCNPSIKLEFASNIVLTDGKDDGDVALNFRVFKQCKHQHVPIPVGPTWNFFTDEPDISTTFSFFVCDSDSCDDECCTYTVVATVADKLDKGSLFVNNATLGAIATCKNRCHECKRNHRY